MAVIGLFVPGRTWCQACLPSVSDRLREQYGAEPEELFPFTGHAVIAPTANLTGTWPRSTPSTTSAGIPTDHARPDVPPEPDRPDLPLRGHSPARHKCDTCGWVGQER